MPALARPALDRATAIRLARVGAVVAALLAVATVAVAALEDIVGLADASPVYLVAVVGVGILYGTWPAIGTAFAAVLVYDFLFTEPRYTLTVADPREWLDLLLFLFVAVAVGRLAALQRERADEADRRARESVASFTISRILATAPDLEAAAPEIVALLLAETRMARIWFTVGVGERLLAGSPPPTDESAPATTSTLARTSGDEPARWVRTHAPRPSAARAGPSEEARFRLKLESEGDVLGSLWARRGREAGPPTPEETRLLSLAADQVALALRREVLAREATQAEVARQSDLLKSALLDSVSHDLRTPLASIRAAAGSLMDPAVELPPEERRATARAIDLEAQRLGRFVRNMLDLSRIEAGALRPDLEVLAVEEVVEPVVERLRPVLGTRALELDLPVDLPPIVADAVFVDEILANLLDNAARYAPPPAPIRIAARTLGDEVELVVEDGGPGVPPDLLPRLFDRFYRVERPRDGARRGMGLGLSVVKGLVEAMGGRVEVGPSELGGLAVRLALRSEPVAAAAPA